MKPQDNYNKFNKVIRQFRNENKICGDVYRERIGQSQVMLVTVIPVKENSKIASWPRTAPCQACGNKECSCKRFSKRQKKHIPEVLASKKGFRTDEMQLSSLADKTLKGTKWGLPAFHYIFLNVPLRWSGYDPNTPFDENRKVMQVTKKLDKTRK